MVERPIILVQRVGALRFWRTRSIHRCDVFGTTVLREFVDLSQNSFYNGEKEQMFHCCKGEDTVMNENELELIRIIRENDNPGQALMTATTIILGFLKQHESSEEQVAVGLPAHV